jgi:hypothetical protein
MGASWRAIRNEDKITFSRLRCHRHIGASLPPSLDGDIQEPGINYRPQFVFCDFDFPSLCRTGQNLTFHHFVLYITN